MVNQPDLVRPAVSAGRRYPVDAEELRRKVEELFEAAPPGPAEAPLALIAPHGDQPGAEPVAARAYAALRGFTYDRVIILAPAHVEKFTFASVFSGRAYATPLGEVPLDHEFASSLCSTCRVSNRGDYGHWPSSEYSLEVQLPYLQVALGDFRLVPVVMGSPDENLARPLGESIAALIKEMGGRNLVVATSDLSHFHRDAPARRMDARALKAIRALDPRGFLEGVRFSDFEACGAGPIAALLEVVRCLGAEPEEDPAYETSFPATNDENSVVGYASVLFQKAA